MQVHKLSGQSGNRYLDSATVLHSGDATSWIPGLMFESCHGILTELNAVTYPDTSRRVTLVPGWLGQS